MDLADRIPPSPPTSTSSTRSPPAPVPGVSPAPTPPKSPDLSRTSPPTPGVSPLPPLPSEVFLLMLGYIPEREISRLCLVARSWWQFLVLEPQLWTTLAVRLEYEQQRHVEAIVHRASVNGAKAGGGLRDVRVYLGSRTDSRRQKFADCIKDTTANERIAQLFSALDYASVPYSYDCQGQAHYEMPSTLRSLTLSLDPNTDTAVGVLQQFTLYSQLPVFNNLRSLMIQVRIPNLRLQGTFFSIWPNLVSLNVFADTEETEDVFPLDLRWNWVGPINNRGRRTVVPENPYLREIYLNGTTIDRNMRLPAFPSLTGLTLRNIYWEGRSLLLLLRLARKTLVSLECYELSFDDAEGFEGEDWEKFIDIRDEALVDGHIFEEQANDYASDQGEDPAPIIFPSLHRLVVQGEITPPFFASMEFAEDVPAFPTPIFVMPALVEARFEDVVMDQEGVLSDSDGPLPTFGRNAPNLISLDLSGITATDQSVFYCLAGMQANLRSLSIANTNLSDRLLAQLPNLVPLLEHLDVRCCTGVTIQGVARCVQVIRDASEGATRVKSVRVDPPQWGDADLTAYLWLDWISVLVRDEWDWEGNGPDGPVERQRWKKQGKMDAELVARLDRAEKEEQERKLAVEQAAKAAMMWGFQQGSSGAGGSYRPSVLQQSFVQYPPPQHYVSASTPHQYVPSSTPHQYILSSTPHHYVPSSTPHQYSAPPPQESNVRTMLATALGTFPAQAVAPTRDPRLAMMERRKEEESNDVEMESR